MRSGGFTYLGVLFLVALMGAGLAATGMLWSTAQQREKERDLLFIGKEVRRAIGNYYERTPGTVKRYPANMRDLLKDNRQLATVRHLRRIYTDPITLNAEWGMIRAPDGGVMGIHSRSEAEPIKRAGFRDADAEFAAAKKYSDWRFVYEPQQPVRR
jgi:type II secretory pathway pseudopilin PulG